MDLKKFSIASTVFALLTTVSSQVYFSVGIDSIGIQVMIVILTGLIAGPGIGITSQLLYLMLFVFTPNTLNDTYLITAFKDPDIGYALSFPIISFIAGYFGHKSSIWKVLLACTLAYTLYFCIGISTNILKTDVILSNYIDAKMIRIITLGFMKGIICVLIYFGISKIKKIDNLFNQ